MPVVSLTEKKRDILILLVTRMVGQFSQGTIRMVLNMDKVRKLMVVLQEMDNGLRVKKMEYF